VKCHKPYHVPKTKTLCQQNSYVVRVARILNTLPEELREPDISFTSFKNMLLNYYTVRATGTIFDLDKPQAQSWKTVLSEMPPSKTLNSKGLLLLVSFAWNYIHYSLFIYVIYIVQMLLCCFILVLSCALCVLYLLNQVVNVIGLRCVDVPVPFCTSVNFVNGKVYK
jgi:hypothetical protein